MIEAFRAALAAEPMAPADGEVAELVTMLHDAADAEETAGWFADAAKWRRTADLLSHLAVREPPEYDEPLGECRKSSESASKPRLDLLPTSRLDAIAKVLTFGAAKYGDNNWCRGARWGRYYSALLRHVFAWWRGEELDPETGLSHLAHAGCCLVFLMEYQRNGWGSDDRFRGADDNPFKKDDGV